MRSMSLSTSICLLTFAACVSAQVVSIGRCPEVKILNTFNLIEFMGVWYEQSSHNTVENYSLKCTCTKYWAGKDNIINVHNEALITLFNLKWEMNGTVRVLAPGQLDISFNNKSKPATEPNLLVLGTDYKNYAVLYSCIEHTKVFHATSLWILTRKREAKRESVIEARKVLEENKISAKHLHETNQADCSLLTVPSNCSDSTFYVK